MTVLEAIRLSSDFLAKKGVDSPRLQAELLLAEVLKLPRMRLYLDFGRELAEAETGSLRELVRRRGAREPLQHILGTSNFCGLEFKVSRQVLVPRPETELLAEQGWTFLQHIVERRGSNVRALDIGTGTGCLAIMLAFKCPAAELWASDISKGALAIAVQNAEKLGLGARIKFLEGDFLGPIPATIDFDLVVSNPPYIPTGELPGLQPEVRDFDPPGALDGGVDGLDFFRRLAIETAPVLKPGGKLMFEFGDGQEQEIPEIFEKQNWIVEAIREDYTRRPRLMVLRKG